MRFTTEDGEVWEVVGYGNAKPDEQFISDGNIIMSWPGSEEMEEKRLIVRPIHEHTFDGVVFEEIRRGYAPKGVWWLSETEPRCPVYAITGVENVLILKPVRVVPRIKI